MLMVLADRVTLCAGLGGPQLTRTMLLTWSQRAISFVRKSEGDAELLVE